MDSPFDSVSRTLRTLWLPLLLCVVAASVYAAVFMVRARQPAGPIAFAVLGTANTPGNRGYDGQYYYRLAVSPLGGRHGLDRPAYRYQRIGYPLLARLLALSKSERIAATLVLVNIGAIALGTLCVALLLQRHGLSPLYAVPYALYIGQVASFWRDLAEPLAFAVTALALVLWRIERFWIPSLLLFVALLSKESVLLFVAAALIHLVLQRHWRAAGQLLLLTVFPYLLWQLILYVAFGQTGLGGTDHPPLLPFGGLSGVRTVQQLLFTLPAVVLPALLCLLLLLHSLRLQWRTCRSSLTGMQSRLHLCAVTLRAVIGDFFILALLANLVLVVWLPARSYADLWASARNAQGLVLAALLSPALASTRLRYPLALLWASCAPLLWLLQ